jgi:repressor of nif and glnA expression
VALDESQLNEADSLILDYLSDAGRATPSLLKEVLLDEHGKDVSSQYINQRLVRLEEHRHVRNVRDTGVYEIEENPEE